MQIAPCIAILLFLTFGTALSQEKIEWTANYELKKEDFKGTPPNTGTVQTVHFQSLIEYSFVSFQLLFSNLNGNVKCNFIPSASWIDEGDQTAVLLRYAQVNWDLRELAARKLRKLFHENRMKLSLKTSEEFYQTVIKESTEIESQYSQETDFGRKDVEQKLWEQKVDQLVNDYAEYCVSCKAPKRKKK